MFTYFACSFSGTKVWYPASAPLDHSAAIALVPLSLNDCPAFQSLFGAWVYLNEGSGLNSGLGASREYAILCIGRVKWFRRDVESFEVDFRGRDRGPRERVKFMSREAACLYRPEHGSKRGFKNS